MRIARLSLVATATAAIGVAAVPAQADGPRDAGGAPADPRALLTVAELSDYKATARYDEVVGLLDRLAAASPLGRRASMGRSVEGREIPLLILADPPVQTPEEAARQVAERGKLVVLLIGNIHGGEVDGKEALPMLARELIGDPQRSRLHPLLRDLIVVMAPIYNCDGNERVSKDNRPGQVGPEEGMGVRHNADGLDLNRDFIKLEAPETRGLVELFNRWDPAVFIDTHTTNGSFHRYLLTYEGPRALAGDMRIVRFVREALLPEVDRAVQRDCGFDTFFYGDFNRDHTRWDSYPAQGRYGTSYVGLRNRISILTEGYSYAPYKDRVLATRDFVRACLQYAAENKERLRKLLADADQATIAAGRNPGDAVVIRTMPGCAPEKAVAAGYVEEVRDGKRVVTEPKDYEVELWSHAEPALTVARPSAYLVPPEPAIVIDKLRRHGIELARLREPVELEVEVYRVERIQTGREPFQKRSMRTLDAAARRERRTLPAGTIVVPTAQRLGSLAVYLLEPQCEDGLATWDFFAGAIAPQQDFPVLRLPAPADLPLEAPAGP
jgi:dipeptidyl-peptidase-4